jgi:aryl-alcohol dehydrogenase-like predicted oxidoreductase
MDYVNLGKTGLRVSRLCLGMMGFANKSDRAWVIDEDSAEPLIKAAVEGGITFFDTADVYSGGASEIATGRLLPRFLSRDEMVVATKVYMPVSPGENGKGLSRKHIMAGIDASLGRLGMDYVDFYQIHRWDHWTPIDETMSALNDVVRAGKARYIGASSMHAWQFAKAQHTADQIGGTRFVSMQNHYNLIYREEEREMIPQCIDMGVAVIPWSPLARGLLTGSRGRDGTKRTSRAGSDPLIDYLYNQATDFDVVERVAEVAKERDAPPAQVALSWLLHKPGVTAPIVGITKPGQVEDALAAEQLSLSQEEIARLEEPYAPHPVLGHI